MDSSTEVSLSWKEFEQCAGEAFSSLLADTELADVTLACADDTLIKAHKLILCTSSPFFKNVLSKNLHSHPLVYMRGVEGRTMEALLSFIYRGEAKVLEADINMFLDTANELRIRGLSNVIRNTEVATRPPPTPAPLRPHTSAAPAPLPPNTSSSIPAPLPPHTLAAPSPLPPQGLRIKPKNSANISEKKVRCKICLTLLMTRKEAISHLKVHQK